MGEWLNNKKEQSTDICYEKDARMSLKTISQRSQAQKITHHLIPLIWETETRLLAGHTEGEGQEVIVNGQEESLGGDGNVLSFDDGLFW